MVKARTYIKKVILKKYIKEVYSKVSLCIKKSKRQLKTPFLARITKVITVIYTQYNPGYWGRYLSAV